MITAEEFIKIFAEASYEEMMMEKNAILRDIQKLESLERAGDRSDAMWRESISPEAKHNMYLQYLLTLCKKMKEKFNVKYIWGEAV